MERTLCEDRESCRSVTDGELGCDTAISQSVSHIENMLFIEMEKDKICRWPYLKCAFFRDRKLSIFRRPYWNYAIQDMEKKFTGGYIRIMLFIDITKLELTGGHFKIMLFIEMEKKIKFPCGHIEIKLFIDLPN